MTSKSFLHIGIIRKMWTRNGIFFEMLSECRSSMHLSAPAYGERTQKHIYDDEFYIWKFKTNKRKLDRTKSIYIYTFTSIQNKLSAILLFLLFAFAFQIDVLLTAIYLLVKEDLHAVPNTNVQKLGINCDKLSLRKQQKLIGKCEIGIEFCDQLCLFKISNFILGFQIFL